MKFVESDGGRAAAGFKGDAGDCVVRAIAIASGKHYREVYDAINRRAKLERAGKRGRRSNAREGVYRRTYERYLREELGATWTPTMLVGSGCKVHLRADELPAGRLVVSVSKHMVAVVDGVVYDTSDPTRGGERCVYGYYTLPGGTPTRPEPLREMVEPELEADLAHLEATRWRVLTQCLKSRGVVTDDDLARIGKDDAERTPGGFLLARIMEWGNAAAARGPG